MLREGVEEGAQEAHDEMRRKARAEDGLFTSDMLVETRETVLRGRC